MGYLTKEEQIDEEFSEIIRDKLTEEQFWEWVSSWKDSDDLCEQAEEWDTITKLETISQLKKKYKLK